MIPLMCINSTEKTSGIVGLLFIHDATTGKECVYIVVRRAAVGRKDVETYRRNQSQYGLDEA